MSDCIPLSEHARPTTRQWTHWLIQLTRVNRQLRAALAQAGRSYGLTEAELLILWGIQLQEDKEATLHCSQLRTCFNQAELTGVGYSAAQISNLVERLRTKGFLIGERSSHDRRRQLWTITAEGQEIADDFHSNRHQLKPATFDTSDKSCHVVLRQVADHLKQVAGHLGSLRDSEAA